MNHETEAALAYDGIAKLWTVIDELRRESTELKAAVNLLREQVGVLMPRAQEYIWQGADGFWRGPGIVGVMSDEEYKRQRKI